MKITLDAKRLSEFRKSKNLTQDELGKAINQSGRTVRRMESTDNNIKLSFKEFHILNSALGIWPESLWADLPLHQCVYPAKITGADQFARIILFSGTNNISYRHVPDDPEIEVAMLDLEKTVNGRNKIDNLENIIKVRNLYRVITSPHRTDRLSFFFYQWRVADFHYQPEDETLSAMWLPKINVLGKKPDDTVPNDRIRRTTLDVDLHFHPETDQPMTRLDCPYPVNEELYIKTVLDARTLPTIENEEKEAQPFEQISKITEETKNVGEEENVKKKKTNKK